MIVKQGRTPRVMPFDMTGVERDETGVLRYSGLPSSLVAMFRATVDQHGDDEALVEVGGERVTYQDFWDRSTRVAGGLRAAGVNAEVWAITSAADLQTRLRTAKASHVVISAPWIPTFNSRPLGSIP